MKANAAALEAELARRLAAYRAGRDWRVLEESAAAALDLTGRPVALLGAGSVLAQPFVAAALARLDVRLLVDNARIGQTMGGHVMAGDAALAAVAAATPGLIAVTCAAGEGGMAHFTRLADGLGLPVLGLFQAMRRLDLHHIAGDAALIDHADPDRLVTALERIAVKGWFQDAASRATLAGLALYRLSWDDRWLAGLRDPGGIYFGSDALDVGPDEVMVDGGAHTGDSIADLARHTGGRWRAVHAFEPDPANADKLAAAWGGRADVILHRLGLWRQSGELRFNGAGQSGSALADDGDMLVPVRALDDLDIGPVSLIKLDVEGAEAAALQGAAATIRRHRPKLALSAYHRVGDLADLPALVDDIQPGYHFRLRHHGAAWFDSVIYATWEGGSGKGDGR